MSTDKYDRSGFRGVVDNGSMATVGLLHPGEMGAAVGGAPVTAGHTVLWEPSGRSRAKQAARKRAPKSASFLYPTPLIPRSCAGVRGRSRAMLRRTASLKTT